MVRHWRAGTGGYGWNACFISTHPGIYGAGVAGSNPQGMSLASITHSAETIMIGEINKTTNPAGVYMTKALHDMLPRTTGVGCGYPPASPTGNRAYRHNDGANVTCFDGHAKWFKESTLNTNPNLWIPAR